MRNSNYFCVLKKRLIIVLAMILLIGTLTVGSSYGAEDKSISETISETSLDERSGPIEKINNEIIKPLLNGLPQEITSLLQFDHPKLEYQINNQWVEADLNSLDNLFPASSSRWYYRFSIDWSAINAATNFDSGDYFTFKLPVQFSNQTITMTAAGGDEWGTIKVDSTGNGKATFNNNIVGKQDVGGQITFSGYFAPQVDGQDVTWTFTFDKETYVYQGETEVTYRPAGISTPSNISKTVANLLLNGNLYHRWNVLINYGEKAEGFTGSAKITDTFGGGYKFIPAGILPANITPQPVNTNKGYYGAVNGETDYAYFFIEELDIGGMRNYYNEHLVGTVLRNGYLADQEIPEDKVSTYFLDYMAGEKYVAGDTMPVGKQVGDYKYMSPYTGGATATLTSDGYVVELPEDTLKNKTLRVYYWTEMTTMVMPETITNSVKAEVEGKDYDATTKIDVNASSTIHGTAGMITIVKQDSNEQKAFADVEFTLKKSGSSYSKTAKTNASGRLDFELDVPYNGTYTLTEDAESTPEGYETGAPITLEIDSGGKITSVNGELVSATSGLKIADVGRVDKEALIMVVYNKKIPLGGIKVLKTDAEDTTKTLSDAEFRLYYSEGGVKHYYPVMGNVWTQDANAAKVFKTDEAGEFTISDLPYRTYSIEEIKAPSGYEIDIAVTDVEVKTEVINQVTIENKQLAETTTTTLPSETETLSELPSSTAGATQNPTAVNHNAPSTGDSWDVLLIVIGIMIISGAICTGLVIRRKKSN